MSVNETLIKNDDAKKVMSRIALKIDTWAKWHDESVAGQGANLILHAGEVAFVQVGSVPPMVDGTYSATAGTVLYKVGDGTSTFKQLPWGSAVAADVYGWAKQDANTFAAWLAGGDGAAGVAKLTDAFVLNSVYTQAVTNINTQISTISKDLETLTGKVNGLEGITGVNTNFATKDEVSNAVSIAKTELTGTNASGTATTIKDASAQAVAAQTTANEAKTQATTNAGEIATLKTKVNTDLEGRVAALEADDTTKTYVDTELGKKVNVSDYNTKMQAIDEKDAEQDGLLSALIGDDTGKSARTIAAEETAKIVANADDNYDTLKEIADWITSDTTGAAKMNSDILANARAIQTLNGDASTKGSVEKAVADEATARAQAITSAINALDMTELSVGAGETIKTVKQADGTISATKQTISIEKSQISDFKDSDYAAAGAFNEHVTNYTAHVAKAVTTDTYLIIDCGTSTINVD